MTTPPRRRGWPFDPDEGYCRIHDLYDCPFAHDPRPCDHDDQQAQEREGETR